MATTIGTSTLCCMNMQQVLSNKSINPGDIRKGTGFLDSITSDLNTRGFEQIKFFEEKARPGANALPKVEIVYRKPSCQTVATTAAGLCDAGAATADRKGYLEPTVDLVSSVSGSFTKDMFNQLCETPNERLVVDLEDAAYAIEQDMNARLLTAYYPLNGQYANGDASTGATAKSINIVSGNGHANQAAFSELFREFKKMHTAERPIVVAGEIGGMYNDIRELGGLGANAIGANTAAGVNIAYDTDLDTIIQGIETDTDSHAVAWIPGAVQLLEWYQYMGYREELGKDDYTETTLTINGRKYDYTLNYDKCTHAWVWTLTKHFDLFCIPDAAYQPCFDFNHKLHIKFGCGDFDCTQINM